MSKGNESLERRDSRSKRISWFERDNLSTLLVVVGREDFALPKKMQKRTTAENGGLCLSFASSSKRRFCLDTLLKNSPPHSFMMRSAISRKCWKFPIMKLCLNVYYYYGVSIEMIDSTKNWLKWFKVVRHVCNETQVSRCWQKSVYRSCSTGTQIAKHVQVLKIEKEEIPSTVP